jgi:hypothetical protein
VKVSIIIIQHQTIIPTTSTSQFCLETFSPSLHLPPPDLQFEISDKAIGFSGVPMHMMAVVSNLRPHALFNVNLWVTATLHTGDSHEQIKRESHSFAAPIESQHCLSKLFVIQCQQQGTVEVTAVTNCQFLNSLHSATASENITIIPSLHITYLAHQTSPVCVQVSIQNLFPSRITDVHVRTPLGQLISLGAGLASREKAATFFMVPSTTTCLDFRWSLPFAQECMQTMSLNLMPESEQNPILLTFENVPQTAPALQQIDVVAKIKNASNEVLNGAISIVKKGAAILPVGTADLRFDGLSPMEERAISLSFISLFQGFYEFPKFQFNLANGRSFVNKAGAGVLVVGYPEQ